MAEKILILGGTKEAAELARKLVSAGHDVTTSLAGRTREPAPIAGDLRTGSFGGPIGMAEYLSAKKFDRLIDATHPFASQISANAKWAADSIGLPIEIRNRPPWKRQPGDQWIEVNSLEKARDKITPGSRVLLALGSQHIDLFAIRADVCFIVRMVDAPARPLPLPVHELLIGKPGDAPSETQILKDKRIDMIVCRNSGGSGAYAKIAAARDLKTPVIIISQPVGG
ncbi:MAG: cobalt-precorrin-6A reductase [Rhizobiaceae bacterium]